MAKEIAMKKHSFYAGSAITLTTKHSKSIAVAPSFLNLLSAEIIECAIDTDMLGTFSGEIERKGSALECAKIKCELGLNLTNSDYGLSSEGSFGPHPYVYFLPANNEILYFIDRKRDFHLHVSRFSEKTNYAMESVGSMQELQKFSKKVLFPSHALIIRPDNQDNKSCIIKGINTVNMLEEAFNHAMNYSSNGKVWVETDMRAHMNPSRMIVIQELAQELAQRLLLLCIECKTPGWGKVAIEKGLECCWCGLKTELIKAEVYGCTKCDYKEKKIPSHGLRKAGPEYCSHCNP